MVISFFVMVPVLSEAITVAEPNVRAEEIFFTMAFRLANRPTARARAIEICAGKPSGTIAAATLTEKTGAAAIESFISKRVTKRTAAIIKVM